MLKGLQYALKASVYVKGFIMLSELEYAVAPGQVALGSYEP
jgi:hypothetical protein